MLDRETYQRLLNAHGRRVANRAAVESTPKNQRGWTVFYACYGSERDLPENERSKPGNPANAFDPTGWNALYQNHPTDERGALHHVTNGQSKYWLDQLLGAREFWGGWVIRFLYDSLEFGGESNATWDAIADDQGEFMSAADGGTLCAWQPGWIGWKNWTRSLSDSDLKNLRHVLGWLRGSEFTHQWPGPGTPESAAFKVTPKVEKNDVFLNALLAQPPGNASNYAASEHTGRSAPAEARFDQADSALRTQTKGGKAKPTK